MRIDDLFNFKRAINGETVQRRLAVRREQGAAFFADLDDWMRGERAGLSRHAPVVRAMDYMLKRWDDFGLLLGDGRICLSSRAAEPAVRLLALRRRSWLFAGSDRGGMSGATINTLIGIARLNDIDP